MATVQLLGRGLYAPQVAYDYGVSPLWLFFKAPPAQNSVIVYKNGDVVEQSTFINTDISDPTVDTYILGGTDFRCEVGSFVYNSLLAQGYTFRIVVPRDTYSEKYTDDY